MQVINQRGTQLAKGLESDISLQIRINIRSNKSLGTAINKTARTCMLYIIRNIDVNSYCGCLGILYCWQKDLFLV